MDLATLTRNKPALAVGGVAAVAGLYALHKKTTTGSASTTTTSSGTTGTSGGVGAYDSTSTDLASQLSAYGQSTQNSLADFGNQLTTSLNGLTPSTAAPSDAGLGGTSAIVPSTPVTTQPVGAVTPVTPSPAPAPPRFFTYAKGLTGGWTTVSKQSGDSLDELRALNGGTLNALAPGQKVRIA